MVAVTARSPRLRGSPGLIVGVRPPHRERRFVRCTAKIM